MKRLPSYSISVSVSASRSGDDLRPGACAAEACNLLLQLGLEHQREEAAEHVAADGLIELVENRPGREQMLGGAEGLLDIPYRLPLII
jgi:hypothetical protein